MPATSTGAIAASILRAALLTTMMLAADTAGAQVMKYMPGKSTSSLLPAQPSPPPQAAPDDPAVSYDPGNAPGARGTATRRRVPKAVTFFRKS